MEKMKGNSEVRPCSENKVLYLWGLMMHCKKIFILKKCMCFYTLNICRTQYILGIYLSVMAVRNMEHLPVYVLMSA